MSDTITTLAEIENAKPGEVTFYSRYTNLKLVRQNALDEVLAGGQRRLIHPGKRYRFEQGTLKVKVGKDVLVDHDGWLHPDAQEGIERDVVDALRSHRRFNKDFWEVGKEPGRLQPYEEDYLADVHRAVAALDLDTLARLIEDERNTHNRPLLVKSATAALETARTTRVALEAEQNDRDAQNAAQAPQKPAKAKPAPKA